MKKTEPLDWMLLVIRLIVGVAFIVHGGHKIVSTTFLTNLPNLMSCSGGLSLVASFAPLTELIGGGLMIAGIAVEIGTLLIIPTMFFAFFIANLKTNCFVNEISLRYAFNLAILVIALGICGPGKWALWDPGKTIREKLF